MGVHPPDAVGEGPVPGVREALGGLGGPEGDAEAEAEPEAEAEAPGLADPAGDALGLAVAGGVPAVGETTGTSGVGAWPGGRTSSPEQAVSGMRQAVANTAVRRMGDPLGGVTPIVARVAPRPHAIGWRADFPL